MIQRRQACGWLVAGLVAGQCAVSALAAQMSPPSPASPPGQAVSTDPAPPLPRAQSPVDFFRELLAMSPAEREQALTNRPPVKRARILAKVREYEALDPNERELRLCATELRWYMLPLLHEAPANRAMQLAAVPDDLKPLVLARLQQWDILPPPMQQEFFESEHALRYFSRVDPTNRAPLPPLPPGPALAGNAALSAAQLQKTAARFNQFFELTQREKERTLNTLSDAERQQIEKTLQTFGRLTPPQRQKCIRAFTQFAGMSASEKEEFLKSARRWAQMSPRERQAWRDLVTHVPEWPPVSPDLLPPLPPAPPPHLSQRLQPLAATNPN